MDTSAELILSITQIADIRIEQKLFQHPNPLAYHLLYSLLDIPFDFIP